jgi:integrase
MAPRKKAKRPHGLGSVTKVGSKWRVRWRENGQRRSAMFTDRDMAERVLAKISGDIAMGRAGLPPSPTEEPILSALAVLWLQRRSETHLAFKDDRGRWTQHLGPYFGHMRPGQVTPATIRAFAESKLPTLSSTTVGHCIRLLSSFFSDLVERGQATSNPVKAVPRATRRLYRNAHDPKDTPFIEQASDIRRVFLGMREHSETSAVVFAVGALAGLRVSEILGLDWSHVDLDRRRIHVRQQAHRGKLTPLKDKESRIVPLIDALLPILREWKASTGGNGLLFKPAFSTRGGIPGHPPTFLRPNTVAKHLSRVLEACGLDAVGLNLYRATRHTFASHWTMAGRSIHTLQAILGHESITTTERYAHLRPDSYSDADLAAVAVDLSSPAGKVFSLVPNAVGPRLGQAQMDNIANVV